MFAAIRILGAVTMNTPSTIFLSIITLLVGMGIGSWIEGLRKRRSTRRPTLPVSTDELAKDGDVKVFGAWRTRSNQVWLEMDGARLNDKAALQPGQYQRLLALVLDLRPWLETVWSAAPNPEATPQPLRPAAPAPTLTQPPIQVGKKKGGPADEPAPPAPVLDSIIQQIDKVLQARLETSAFKARGIQLVEGPGGIVIIKDGINKYEGVDAIPDPEVKSLIRQAVADWEKGPK